MKALRIAAVVLWTLTALQVIAGLVTLYLWAFDLVNVPKDAGVALMFGPWITGAGALGVGEVARAKGWLEK